MRQIYGVQTAFRLNGRGKVLLNEVWTARENSAFGTSNERSPGLRASQAASYLVRVLDLRFFFVGANSTFGLTEFFTGAVLHLWVAIACL